MAARNINEVIDRIIKAWHDRFDPLRERQAEGVAVSDQEFQAVALETGQDIYTCGLIMADVESNGHKVSEFKDVYDKVNETKVSAGSVVDGLPNDVQVNPVQAAALKNASGNERTTMIEQIKADTNFIPGGGGIGEAVAEANAALISGRTGDEVMDHATDTAKDLLGEDSTPNTGGDSGIKTGPGSPLGTQVTTTDSETTNVAQGGTSGSAGDGTLGIPSGEIIKPSDGTSNPATGGVVTVNDGVASDPTGVTPMAGVTPGLMGSVDVSTPIAPPTPVVTPEVPPLVIPAAVMITDSDGVSRDLNGYPAADQAKVQQFIADGGKFGALDTVAAIYASGDPQKIQDWENFVINNGGTPTGAVAGFDQSAADAARQKTIADATAAHDALIASYQGYGAPVPVGAPAGHDPAPNISTVTPAKSPTDTLAWQAPATAGAPAGHDPAPSISGGASGVGAGYVDPLNNGILSGGESHASALVVVPPKPTPLNGPR